MQPACFLTLNQYKTRLEGRPVYWQTNTVKVSLLTMGNCEDISRYFLEIYQPNNQMICD